MKKTIIILVIMICPFIGLFAQDIQYKLYGKYLCNDSIFAMDLYELQKDSFRISTLDPDFILLPDTGKYLLETSYIDPKETIYVDIPKFGQKYSDTIVVMSVFEYLFHPKNQGGWVCCEKLCDGYVIDYYNNGRIRIEGSFKKGKPIGKIKYYYPDGTLMGIDYYNKKGKLIKWESY